MSGFTGRTGFALVLAAGLSLAGGTAHAQAGAGPFSYWMPAWLAGLGDNSSALGLAGFGAETQANGLPRYNFSNGWFVGGESSGIGSSFSGFNQLGAFGSLGGLRTEGVQFGYDFKKTGGLPVTVFGGFDSLKYNSGLGAMGAFGAFDSANSTVPGYSAHAGVEFRPTSNLSLSFGASYTQRSSGHLDSDINSPLLPGASPFFGGLR
jgi:hypothetical protein